MRTWLALLLLGYVLVAMFVSHRAESQYDADPDFDEIGQGAKTAAAVIAGLFWLPLVLVGIAVYFRGRRVSS